MEIKNKNVGFSLVELLVVIAIISVLSVSSVVGWARLSAVLTTRQSGEVIKDVIKNTSLQVLANDFDKSKLYFKKGYLIKEELFEDSPLVMKLGSSCTDPSPDGLAIESDGKLIQKNERGRVMVIEYVFASDSDPTEKCFDFGSVKDTEWIYELTDGNNKRVMDFIHFNLNRDSNDVAKIAKIKIGNSGGETAYGDDLDLTLTAPYAKAQYFKGSTLKADPITLYLQSVNDSTVKEPIALQ